MRQIVVFSLLLLVLPLASVGQASGGFDYQALVYEAGAPLAEKSVLVKIALQDASGQVYYEEEHPSLKTEATGLLRVPVGEGQPKQGTFGAVPWSKGILVAASLNAGGGYRALGPAVRLQAVPYALRARGSSTLRGGASNREHDTPIFDVVNSEGKSVFAVYEEGVVMSVAGDQDEAVRRGGFNVATRKADGSDQVNRLLVDEGFRAQVDEETGRGVRGGFAVATYSSALRGDAKEQVERLWVSGPGMGFVLDDDAARGVRGGFAVARRTLGGGLREAFSVSGGLIEAKVDPVERGVRGGFAVSLRSATLRDGEESAQPEGAVQRLMNLDERNSYLTVAGRVGEEGTFSFRTRTASPEPLVSITPSGQIVTADGAPDKVFAQLPKSAAFTAKWASSGVQDPGAGPVTLRLTNAIRAAHPLTEGAMGQAVELGLQLETSDPLFEGLEIGQVRSYGDGSLRLGVALKPNYTITAPRTIAAEKVEAALEVYLLDNPLLRQAVQRVSIDLQPTYYKALALKHSEATVAEHGEDGMLFVNLLENDELAELQRTYKGLVRNTLLSMSVSDSRVEFTQSVINLETSRLSGLIRGLEAFFRDGGQQKGASSEAPGKWLWEKKVQLLMRSPALEGGEKVLDLTLKGAFSFE